MDDALASRLLDGMQVAPASDASAPNDLESPLRLGFLNRAEGYRPSIADHLVKCLRYESEPERMLLALQVILQTEVGHRRIRDHEDRLLFDVREVLVFSPHSDLSPVGEMILDLIRNGMAPADLRRGVQRYEVDYREMTERMVIQRRNRIDFREFLVGLAREGISPGGRFRSRELLHWLMRYVEVTRHDLEPLRRETLAKQDEDLFDNR